MRNPRLRVSETTIKRLFAKSNNKCAFPGCWVPMVDDSDIVRGEMCHIHGARPRAKRYNPDIPEADRYSIDNLILLCADHHKVIDSAPEVYTVEKLRLLKRANEAFGQIESTPDIVRRAGILASALLAAPQRSHSVRQNMTNCTGGTQTTIIADQVKFYKSSSRKTPPPAVPTEGAIGNEINQRNYIQHLIDRYIDFSVIHTTKAKSAMGPIIHRALKKEFKVTRWDYIPSTRFLDAVSLLQNRILKTRFGRNQNAQGIKCFSTWNEWLMENT